jgi:NADH-quinone oxidoreductase subunit L
MADYTYTLLIPLIPFLVFLTVGLSGHKMKPFVSGLIGTTGLGISAILSYMTAMKYFFTAHAAGTAIPL